MNDLISRQAAIEAIDAVFPVDPMKSEYAQGIACGAALAKTYVEQLPSAQPEIITVERRMKLMEYYCCGLHHSSYCPECLGKLCKDRLKYALDPQGGNKERIAKINSELAANAPKSSENRSGEKLPDQSKKRNTGDLKRF